MLWEGATNSSTARNQNNYNTKSTDAQGKLKPRSVITREEGTLGMIKNPNSPDSQEITD